MNANIKTEHTNYELRDSDKIGVSILNGGQFNNLEVKVNPVEAGKRMSFTVLNDPENRIDKNQMFNTSLVQDVELHPELDSEYTVKTLNNTYSLKSVSSNPDIMLLTSPHDGLTDLEVDTPVDAVEGNSLRVFATANPDNGSWSGRFIATTPIQSVDKTLASDNTFAKSHSMSTQPFMRSVLTAPTPVATPTPVMSAGKQLSATSQRSDRPMSVSYMNSTVNNANMNKAIDNMDKINPVVKNSLSAVSPLGRPIATIKDEPQINEPQEPQTNEPQEPQINEPQTNEPQSAPAPATKRKNPFKLAAEFAKNKLSWLFKTQHNDYTLSPVKENNRVMTLSNDSFEHPYEVVKPDRMPSVGEKLVLQFTDNDMNGKMAGEEFKTSSVRDKFLVDEDNNRYTMAELNGHLKTNDAPRNIETIYCDTRNSKYTFKAIEGRDDAMDFVDEKNKRTYEVYKPEVSPEVGEPMAVHFTDSLKNGSEMKNNVLFTSPVTSVSTMQTSAPNPSKAVSLDNVERGAKKFTMNYQGDNLYTLALQIKTADITNRAAEILGLPDDAKPEIYFSSARPLGAETGDNQNYISDIAFKGFPDSPETANAIKQAILEDADTVPPAGCKFGPTVSVGQHEFAAMQDALSEQGLSVDNISKINQAIKDMEANTEKNPLLSEISTSFIPERSDDMQYDPT